ncbi:putative short-chain dehydrogenase/reductase Atnbp [[Candida] jaroonii]|uniref:Short-chain dehydrogenase/reductase Atnbp n=1 Tax=[Candida] jaroonii TaxID=467808 RepID=A0ACA9YFV1_9ASCO|nr:putative short-chain dehydrogenase/reductase Atnbp [[Candida] jaroonii]
MNPPFKFNSKNQKMRTYFITGANRGIGLGVVTELLKDNNNKVLVTVRKSASVEDLEALGSKNLLIYRCDIGVEDEVDEVFEQIVKDHTTIDVAILNAGMLHSNMKSPTELTETREEWRDFVDQTNEVIRVNAFAQIYIANKLLPLVEKSVEKKIIFLTSTLGSAEYTEKSKFDTIIPYSVSKAVLNMIIAKYAAYGRSKGMTIMGICPGIVNSNNADNEAIEAHMAIFTPGLIRVKEDYVGMQSLEAGSKKLLKAIEFFTPFHTGRTFSSSGSEHLSA